MSINIKKILEHIDEIGIQETIDKIGNYDVIGPSSEEFFGIEPIKHLEKEIKKDKYNV